MMAAMLAEAGPAGAAAREPTEDGPGEAAENIPNDFVGDTKLAGNNCYGQAASNHVKGPGGDPGSLAVPTTFDPDAEGPLPAGPNYTGHAVSTLDPGQISGFQQESRDLFAGESCDL